MMINPNHILPQTIVKGDIIRLKTTSGGHWNGESPQAVPESAAVNFAEMFKRTLNKVNDQLVNADALTQKMIEDPSKVKIHSVLIAAEKARMSLTYTKTIADLAVKTYKELTNLR